MSEQIQTLGEESNEKRISGIREVLDLKGTLPRVSFEHPERVMENKGTYVSEDKNIVHDGVVVGRLTLVTDRIRRRRWFNGITVDEAYRGKGLGLAAYVQAIEEALGLCLTFTTHDWSQTPQAIRIWKRLADRGIATEIEPFVPDGHGNFIGIYEVQAVNIIGLENK